MEFVISHFGLDRLLWDSDWPVCLLLAGYYDTWETARALLATETDED